MTMRKNASVGHQRICLLSCKFMCHTTSKCSISDRSLALNMTSDCGYVQRSSDDRYIPLYRPHQWVDIGGAIVVPLKGQAGV